MQQTKFNTVDEYIAYFPKGTATLLQELRAVIKETIPAAEEVVSYNMPAYNFHGKLVYFAGNKEHIGFYPLPSAIKFFEKDLKNYETSKGTIKFYIEDGIPRSLVKKIMKFRAQENKEIAERKTKTKAASTKKPGPNKKKA